MVFSSEIPVPGCEKWRKLLLKPQSSPVNPWLKNPKSPGRRERGWCLDRQKIKGEGELGSQITKRLTLRKDKLWFKIRQQPETWWCPEGEDMSQSRWVPYSHSAPISFRCECRTTYPTVAPGCPHFLTATQGPLECWPRSPSVRLCASLLPGELTPGSDLCGIRDLLCSVKVI